MVMKILFCKISAMKFYKGAQEGDVPYNGGKFVDENGYGHEEYNFDPVDIDGEDYLFGFVETKSTRGKRNDLRIENIQGCEAFENDDSVEGVLVIWCATTDLNQTSIVGWYKDATVYRRYQELQFDSGYIQDFNIKAKKENCVLIPHTERNRHIWNAPTPKTHTYGFGQALVWYAKEEKAENYINRLIKNINEYDGGNDIDKSVNDIKK